MDDNYNGNRNKSHNQTSGLQESSKNKENSGDLESSSLEAEEGSTVAKYARVTNKGFERQGCVGTRIACSFENIDSIVHAQKKINPYEPFDSPCETVPNHVSYATELHQIRTVFIVLAVAIIMAIRLNNVES